MKWKERSVEWASLFLFVVASASLSNRIIHGFVIIGSAEMPAFFLFLSVLSYCNARSGIISNLLHNFVS